MKGFDELIVVIFDEDFTGSIQYVAVAKYTTYCSRVNANILLIKTVTLGYPREKYVQ